MNDRKLNIMLAYRSFDRVAGGVQRMATLLMHEMIRRGHRMSLLTWDHVGAETFYDLPEEIKWYKIGIGDHTRRASRAEIFQRALKARAFVRQDQPDVILGFQDGPFRSMRAFTAGMGVPVVLAERNAPTRFDLTGECKNPGLRYQSFRLAKAITLQCESFRDMYPRYLHDKIAIIPNPVFPPADHEKMDCVSIFDYGKVLLSVGRLAHQKNYGALIEAFAKIAGEVPEWTLVIIGEGEERAVLEGLIDKRGLKERVFMPGTMKDIWKAYYSADLFCLPSRFEGFPNALAEALIRGLPAAGYKGCAGVCDLIEENINGRLAEGNGDPDSLARVLLELMRDEPARKELAERAAKTMLPYRPEMIYNRWEDFLKKSAN